LKTSVDPNGAGFCLFLGEARDDRAFRKGLVDLFSERASLPRWPSYPGDRMKKATQRAAFFDVEPEGLPAVFPPYQCCK
jgi:hypothetical protein